ncbi:MAG: response regulator transcription factor [Firmicutes bacterium]|nr:response regulator transcription factor [Bacillota bacterium]MBE6146706.1 response regulator transcription factor [Bacillota bacterium]
MINYILYEDDKRYREKYISVIKETIGVEKDKYQIIEIDKYDKETSKRLESLVGKKIYIVDIEVPGKSGLDLAKQIRQNGDWESPIIVVTVHEHLKTISFNGKLLMLDFVTKYFDLESRLKESLIVAFDIVTKYDTLSLEIAGEVYQFSYSDILYIEKNKDDDNVKIIMKKEVIELKERIVKIEERLDSRFYKISRSCIVNTHNITKVKFKEGIIIFGKKEMDQLPKSKRKELRKRLIESQMEKEEEATEIIEEYCVA